MSMITPLLVGYASKYEVEVYRELNDCKFGLLLYEYCTKSAMGAMSDRCIDRSKNFCHRVVLATVYSTLATVYYTFCTRTVIPVRVQLSSEIASSLVFGTHELASLPICYRYHDNRWTEFSLYVRTLLY